MPRPKQFEMQDVLRKAMELFWEKGYHGTSMQDLVTHLGINRGSLYTAFEGKYPLFVAALTHYQQVNSGHVLALLESDFPVRDKLRSMLQMVVEMAAPDGKRKGCFVVNSACELAADDNEIQAFARNNMATMVDRIEAALRSGQENGEISPDHDAHALANYFFNTHNGIMVLGKSGADRAALEGVVKVSLMVLDTAG